MTKAGFEGMLQAMARAWAARDYAGAAGWFAEDVRYADPLRYRHASRRELLRFFEDDEGREQRTVWHNAVFDGDRQVGAAEYTYEGTNRYHGLVLIKLRDDKVTHWREYQHVSDLDWEDFWAGAAFSG